MLGNYDLLLESSQELQEFLVFLYENDSVIADIDIPFEWKGLIDESYDDYGNQYYSLTNRGIELLISEGFLDNIKKKAGLAVGKTANAIQGASVKAHMGLEKARDASHKLGKNIDKKIDDKLGKEHPKLSKNLKNARKVGTSLASHVALKSLLHEPQAAHLAHGAITGGDH